MAHLIKFETNNLIFYKYGGKSRMERFIKMLEVAVNVEI